MGDHASLDLTTGVTLEALAKGTTFAGDFRTIAGKGPTGQAYYFRTRASGATFFAVHQATIAKFSPEVVLALDTWYYVAGTYQTAGPNVLLYIDGSVNTGDAATGAFDTNNLALEIGRRVGGNDDWWIGDIDEVRVSNIARSAAWVKATYNTCFDTLITYGSEESDRILQVPRG